MAMAAGIVMHCHACWLCATAEKRTSDMAARMASMVRMVHMVHGTHGTHGACTNINACMHGSSLIRSLARSSVCLPACRFKACFHVRKSHPHATLLRLLRVGVLSVDLQLLLPRGFQDAAAQPGRQRLRMRTRSGAGGC
eukprot:351377-Chlamydomonas_euryale.AAC.8